jgi:hypothetical protein
LSIINNLIPNSISGKITGNPPAPTNTPNFPENPTDQTVPVNVHSINIGQSTGSNTGNTGNTPINPPTNNVEENLNIFNNLIPNSISGVGINPVPTAIVIGGQTITFVPPIPTVVSGGRTLVFSSGHTIGGSATVPLFAPGGNGPAPTAAGNVPTKPTASVAIFGSGSRGGSLTATTIGGVTIPLGPSIAVISGKTYTIGPSVMPTTIVVNGQTISIGPGGVGFATTALSPPSLFTGGAAASRDLAKFSKCLPALFLALLVGLL